MMSDNDTEQTDQILEDKLFSDPMCVVEIVGWSLFIISLVIGLLVAKLSLPIEPLGWLCFGTGLTLAFWGSYKRDKSNVCSINTKRNKE